MIENTVVPLSTNGGATSKMVQDKESILKDFRTCCLSRDASLLARKEVLTGKAKFGITGDGKEVPQVALARAMEAGDFRSGYYRDQTLMFALEISSIEDFFAQLYADSDNDPFSAGRQMNNHFATPFVDKESGNWTNHLNQINISSDVSSTGGQMARALGLAHASKKFRQNPKISKGFSNQGNEICFTTIGDASTSEGVFWETMNAAAVLQVPLMVCVWDDGYGISVPKKFQTAKASISKALEGFQATPEEPGIDIYKVKGWDYPTLVDTFIKAAAIMRETHRPALFHVEELTQPQGHSTSGSHERYKSKERLQWERENDCILRMEKWIIDSGIATATETKDIRRETKIIVKEARAKAWKTFYTPVKERLQDLKDIYQEINLLKPELQQITMELNTMVNPILSEALQTARRVVFQCLGVEHPAVERLKSWVAAIEKLGAHRYHTHLYSETPKSALQVPVVPVEYDEQSPTKNGFEILNAFFNKKFGEMPNTYAFGEDVGQIGDVNQGFAGLQKKYSINRIGDTGIREWTIMGQAIGMAMRGLRPIAEIQYLDYLIYGLEPLSDDLATLRYRSAGIQAAPAIIRTRGHRLEGIWHAGSPLGMIINSLRGIYILVPRNMTQAAGFYNTMLQSDDPALIIECLNGYRLKEKLPKNIGTYTVPLGVPEVIQEGADITVVTYGSCVRVALEGARLLEKVGVSVEIVDVQSLLPFDLEHRIVQSLQKTNRILFLDEDVPGGASAYMLQKVMEEQKGYQYLDSAPQTLTAKAHRTPFGSDGDYFTKPNPEDVFESIYRVIQESDPGRLPAALS